MNERFVTPCELPNAHQRELLTILIEEAAEVQQRATKMLRFGVLETQPGQPDDNARRLGMEVGDFKVVAEIAVRAGLMRPGDIADGEERKHTQLAKFMQTRAAPTEQDLRALREEFRRRYGSP